MAIRFMSERNLVVLYSVDDELGVKFMVAALSICQAGLLHDSLMTIS